MKITSFINSLDIAEYLEKIGYEFSPLEAAYLVWQCERLTVEEKQHAWVDIINTMPQIEVFDGAQETHFDNLHTFLNLYIKLQNKYIDAFFSKGAAVYEYVILKEDGFGQTDGQLFENLDACYKAIIDKLANEPAMLKIRKRWFKSNKEVTLIMNMHKEVFNVEVSGFYGKDDERFTTFDYMDLKFLMPFKKGDILCERRLGSILEPFALLGFSDWGKQKACVMMPVYSGDISKQWLLYPLCLEYYKKRLLPDKLILMDASRYLKGEIDLAQFEEAKYNIN